MHRRATPAFALSALLLAAAAPAKFGITKTNVVLTRSRPPALQLAGETVAVEVASDTGSLRSADLDEVRDSLAGAFRGWALFRVVEDPKRADTVVRVSIDGLEARIDTSAVYEQKYVKTGERREWNAKKQRWETKDVWGYRKERVDVRKATGRADARVEVLTAFAPGVKPPGSDRQAPNTLGDVERSVDVGASYEREWKGHASVPSEARDEGALERHLLAEVADKAKAAVTFVPEPVEVLLAVDDELKPGNRLAEDQRFDLALTEWGRLSLKGDKEAARLHNLGVAHEGLAYRSPADDPAHKEHLEAAEQAYRRARELDPDEKYFKPPLERIKTSLAYADAGQRFLGLLEQSRQGKGGGPALPAPAAASARKPTGPSPGPLRNGSFEAGLASWRIEGKGSAAVEAPRGKVAELAGGAQEACAAEELDIDLGDWPSAHLSLDYRIVSGEARIRAQIVYADAAGKERTSSLEITAGEAPGPWSTWETDLVGLRPRPARIQGLRLTVQAGTVRLDNVALTLR